MTAKRLARPASTLACYAHGLADDVYGPEAKPLALEPLERALEFRLQPIAALARERCCRTADRFNAAVDLLCWDTTTRSGESDAEDDAGEAWHGGPRPALRTRGPNQEGRDGNPPVVVGVARTRDGLPVRAWGWPGHTAAVTTIHHLKDDGRGGRLNRGVLVGASGRCAAAHRPRLSRAVGRYLLAVPLRQVTAVHREVLSRPGRYRDGAATLRVQDVVVGEGERRRRSRVCHHPDAAAREQAHRARLWARVRAARAALAARPADHPQNACALRASRRCGRDLRIDARGRRSLDPMKVAAEAQEDGTCVVTTNDDPRDAEEVALGDTSLLVIEGGFRRMKTTGLPTRPSDHGRPHRIIAPVPLGVLALRLERAAESRCQQTWRTIRQALDPLTVVRYRMHGQTMLHSPQVTATRAETLRSLGMPLPKKILAVSD